MGDRGKIKVGPVVRPSDRISVSDVSSADIAFANVKREFQSFLLERIIPKDGKFTDIPDTAHEEKVDLHKGPSPLHKAPVNNFVLLRKHFEEFLETLGFYVELRNEVRKEKERIEDFLNRRNYVVRMARKPLEEERAAEQLRIKLLELTREIAEVRERYEKTLKEARKKRAGINREAAELFSKKNDHGNVDTPVMNYYRKKEMLERATFVIYQNLVDAITDPDQTFGAPAVTSVEGVAKAYREKTGKSLFAEIEREIKEAKNHG